jgi:hypothetical protein
MFTKKIIAKLLTLSIMLSCLGFAVMAKAESAKASCRICFIHPQLGPMYCTWKEFPTCSEAPPVDSNPTCILVESCDPI